jgi:hypothetical protein
VEAPAPEPDPTAAVRILSGRPHFSMRALTWA